MNNGSVIILGAGGGSRELLALMRDACAARGEPFPVAGILDDNPVLQGSSVDGAAVLGPLELAHTFAEASFLCGMANARNRGLRLAVAGRLALPERRWGRFLHPRAWVADNAVVGEGVILYPGSIVSSAAAVGAHSVVYYNAVIHHDSRVGPGCSLCAGVCVAGGVTVGRGSYLGAGCVIRDGVRIGEGALIGMGAVVVNDVSAGETVVGVPARPIGGKPP